MRNLHEEEASHQQEALCCELCERPVRDWHEEEASHQRNALVRALKNAGA